jgi:hypothetical protein
MSDKGNGPQDGYWEGLVERQQEKLREDKFDLKVVARHLEYAREYNLEPEMVWSAIKYAQANPKAEMLEVMHYGCEDWDVHP